MPNATPEDDTQSPIVALLSVTKMHGLSKPNDVGAGAELTFKTASAVSVDAPPSNVSTGTEVRKMSAVPSKFAGRYPFCAVPIAGVNVASSALTLLVP